jgi:hypothetical protein
MPVNEISKHSNTETRSSIEAVLGAAWQELGKDGNVEAKLRERRVADQGKLKSFAIHAWCERCRPDERTSVPRALPRHTSGG